MKKLNKLNVLIIFIIVLFLMFPGFSFLKAVETDWVDIGSTIESNPATTLCFDPYDHSIVYTGVDSKGVYKVTESGKNWTLLNNGLSSENSKTINILKIDPTDPNVMYLGTKAGLSSSGGKWIVYEGFFKSTDGGASWAVSNSGIIPIAKYIAYPPSVYDIAIDPDNHQVLYIGTYEGIYKSTDGGENWNWSGEGMGDVSTGSIIISPFESKTLYASSVSNGVYVSNDNGNSWREAGLKEYNIRTLAMSPNNKNIIYAGGTGIFKTTDGGNTWSDLNLKDNDTTPTVRDIEISNKNPAIIYLATNTGIFKSSDNGASWSELKPSKLILSWGSNDIALSDDNILYSAANGFIDKAGGLLWMWQEESVTPQEETGSITLKTNLSSAKFTVTGPAIYQGTGTTYQINNAPVGEYTVIFTAVAGYNTPSPIKKTLSAGGSITFDATYTKIVEQTTTIVLYVGNTMMYINGVEQEIDPGRGTTPIIISKWGRTIVPIRALVESLGGTIDWDGNTRKVTINFKGTLIELWIDNPKAKVNGTENWIDPNNHDVRPTIINSRTMLPLRFVAESMGCKVDWDQETSKITITYPQ
jgi:photosystem II stability/assembly factor-like uncharacterized protein